MGVSVDKVFSQASLGGTLSGGVLSATQAQDTRIKVYEVQPGGAVNLTYTAPTLASGQSGNAYVQVMEMDNAGLVTGQLDNLNIGLNGSSGATHPQPKLLYTMPAYGQWNVGRNAKVVLGFSQPLDPATINSSTIYSYGVAGTLALSAGTAGPNTVVTFTPSAPLDANRSYNFLVYSSVKAADGQSLTTSYYFNYSTGSSNDTTVPNVLGFNPVDGMTSVPMNVALKVQFSEPINPLTVSSASVKLLDGSIEIPYTWSISASDTGPSSLLRLNPMSTLSSNRAYTLSVTGDVRDAVGSGTPPAATNFVTGNALDNARPSVSIVIPASSATGVPLNSTIQLTFSEAIDRLSLCCGNLVVRDTDYWTVVPGSVAFDLSDSRITFTPSYPLRAGANYRIEISSEVRDLAGNSSNPLYSYFRTALAAGTGTLPNAASLVMNPPEMYADGLASSAIVISNINTNGTTAPNGTRIGITAQPVFNPSVGGAVTGANVGASPDARFLVFETLGGKVSANFTPSDMTWLAPDQTRMATIQVVSLDAENNPVALLASAPVSLYGIKTVTVSSTDTALTDNHEDLLGVVKDYRDRLVTDGSRVGLQVVDASSNPVAWGVLAGGTVSASEPGIRIYSTAGGQFTAGFDGPVGQQCHLGVPSSSLTVTNRNRGTLRVITVDSAGRDSGLVTTSPIECYNVQ